jgi:hypothetical protein
MPSGRRADSAVKWLISRRRSPGTRHAVPFVGTNDRRARPERAERGDTMPMDNWYDLAIRELSDLTDPVAEKLAEVEQALPEPPEADDEDAPAPPAASPRSS